MASGVAPKIIGTPYHGTHTLGNWESDNAYDFATPIGTPLYAAYSGTIGSQIGSLGSGGRFAGLRLHLVGAAQELYYAHLSKIVVKAGQAVKAGQLVGYSGEASGVAHLHLGARGGDAKAYEATIFGMGGTTTPTGGVKDTGGASESFGGWAGKFLQAIKAPITRQNLQFMVAWLNAENPSSTYTWNPLATTLKTQGSLRSGGVQAYKDELSGIRATTATIQEGQYAAVRAALAKGDNSQATWDALRASPWDAGHYAGTPSVASLSPSTVAKPIVGSKKGSGGIDNSITGHLGQAAGAFGDLPGVIASAPGDAVGAATDGIEGAIGKVGDVVEDVAVRFVYGFVGLVLGSFALLLVVRTVQGQAPSIPSIPAGATGSAAKGAGAAGAGASVAEIAAVA